MKTLPNLVSSVATALGNPLPGQAAQYRMAPIPRPGGESFQLPGPDARNGGVLVLFYPHQAQIYLPLILRPTYNGTHSGQVAFPGGGQEAQDQDITATALREAYEELGIQSDRVHILGRLTPLYIRPSNYLVTPTLGWTAERPCFQPDPYEVARLLETPLSALQDPANRRSEVWQLRDREATVPFFEIQGQMIWGATAMILSELLTILERSLASNQIDSGKIGRK